MIVATVDILEFLLVVWQLLTTKHSLENNHTDIYIFSPFFMHLKKFDLRNLLIILL